MATKSNKETYRVRAVGSAHIFYGDEHPALGGVSYRLNPGEEPKEVTPDAALYFSEFPDLRVDTTLANPDNKLED